MPKKIFYWDDVIAKENLAIKHLNIIKALQDGSYKEAQLDLKKTPNHCLYTVRINSADRLLFATIERNGLRYLLLLEEIENHDYQKSRFLKPKALKAFIENKAASIIEEALSDEHFLPCTDEFIVDNLPENEPALLPMRYYREEFIELNDMQNQAAKHSLPLIVKGSAGSGKSLIGIELLARKTEEDIFDKQEKILYITQSENLIAEMHKLWQAHPSSNNNDQVIFKTYKALMLLESPNLADYKSAGKAEFQLWLKQHIQKLKKILSTPLKKPELSKLLNKNEKLYQEFRVISVYFPDKQQNYFDLGQRQSIFTANVERKLVWQLYEKYQNFLTQERQYDLAFSPLNSAAGYQFIIVDEAQDFSHLQLQQIFQQAKEQCIVFCIDNNQSITDDLSKGHFLMELSAKMSVIELPGSYRCPKPVVALGNLVLGIKYYLTGGTLDKQETVTISPRHSKAESLIQWVEPGSQEVNELKTTIAGSSNWAVITDGEHKAEAKKLFSTPLVFTIQEAKGLEYKNILLYSLLDNELFYQADSKLSCVSVENLTNKEKIGSSIFPVECL